MPAFTPLDIEFLKLPPINILYTFLEKLSESDISPVNAPYSVVQPILSIRPIVHYFKHISDAMSQIEEGHCDRYIYRGQSKRHQVEFTGKIPSMQSWLSAGDIDGDVFFTVYSDSLVPSSFRVSKPLYLPPSIQYVSRAFRAISQSRTKIWIETAAAYFRDILNPDVYGILLMLSNFGAIPGVAKEVEYDSATPNAHQSLLRLISLSQHYELGSSMVDFTRNPTVASWFATNTWDGQPVKEGHGVIYRLDTNAYERTIRETYPVGDWHFRLRLLSSILGLVDISDEPKQLGLRPSAQEGYSVLGLENAIMYLLMEHSGALEAFVFPHTSESAHLSSITKADLCPCNDPALAVFARAPKSEAPMLISEIEDFLHNAGFSKEDRERIRMAFRYGIV